MSKRQGCIESLIRSFHFNSANFSLVAQIHPAKSWRLDMTTRNTTSTCPRLSAICPGQSSRWDCIPERAQHRAACGIACRDPRDDWTDGWVHKSSAAPRRTALTRRSADVWMESSTGRWPFIGANTSPRPASCGDYINQRAVRSLLTGARSLVLINAGVARLWDVSYTSFDAQKRTMEGGGVGGTTTAQGGTYACRTATVTSKPISTHWSGEDV